MKTLFMFLAILPFWLSCSSQDQKLTVTEIGKQLAQGRVNTNALLTDPATMAYHSLTPFRELIKKFATTEPLSITVPYEPGVSMIAKGIITDKSGKPRKGLLLYFYQTDNKGWYADTAGHVRMMEGDRRHARLFGYVKTGKKGEFEIHTIHPHGYPDSNLPQHIHFEIYDDTRSLKITELLFDDDERLTPSIRKRYLHEGAYISVNTGTKTKQVYQYTIRL